MPFPLHRRIHMHMIHPLVVDFEPGALAKPCMIYDPQLFHQKFGNGVVLNVEGDHLEIAFKHAGMKKILAEYVELAP